MAGCAERSDYGLNPKEPQTIEVWHYYNGAQAAAMGDLVDEFNKTEGEKLGIVVQAVSKNSMDELFDSLMAAAQEKPGADELPNIFQGYADTVRSLDEMGLLADLGSYLTEEEADEYVDSYLQQGRIGEAGRLKLFPIAKSTEVLVLNETMFHPFAEECGITEEDLSTWEGLARTAEAYYEYTGGESFFGRDAFANYMLIGSRQLGTEIFEVKDNQAEVHLDEDVMRKLWENYYIPYVKGYYQHVGRFRTDDMKTGSIAAAVCSNTGITYLPPVWIREDGSTQEMSYRVLPTPNFEGAPKYAVQQGAGMAVVKSDEAQEYASMVFLKWLTETEHNIQMGATAGYLPVKKSANDINYMNEYLKQTDLEVSDLEYQALETAIRQVQECNLYTQQEFENSYSARNSLNTSMIELAKKDREQILAEVSEGKSEAEAMESYLTEAYFLQWYQTLKEQLNDICRGG